MKVLKNNVQTLGEGARGPEAVVPLTVRRYDAMQLPSAEAAELMVRCRGGDEYRRRFVRNTA